ncbi:MAG: type II toxin-antitoxin system ParD family antitoxin [Pyrinomonadaceae bacterium]|nr:type II toxin-antitoxin system ParD family antitoxin [Pyrinomonadaceae bacterium]
MNVSLTKELENFIGELVASGMYYSASEVVRDGLRLLKEQEALKKMRVEELRAEIMLGIKDLKTGNSMSFTSEEEIFQEIKKRGQKRLDKKRNGK